LLRVYFYHCLPYQSARPTTEESERFRKAEAFHAAIERIPNFEVKLGRLVFRGFSKEDGRPIFEQKRVDVQLAVDLLTLSYTRQMGTAILVTGDSDFIPAIQISKMNGVQIILYHGISNPAHRELMDAADRSVVIDQAFIDQVRMR